MQHAGDGNLPGCHALWVATTFSKGLTVAHLGAAHRVVGVQPVCLPVVLLQLAAEGRQRRQQRVLEADDAAEEVVYLRLLLHRLRLHSKRTAPSVILHAWRTMLHGLTSMPAMQVFRLAGLDSWGMNTSTEQRHLSDRAAALQNAQGGKRAVSKWPLHEQEGMSEGGCLPVRMLLGTWPRGPQPR